MLFLLNINFYYFYAVALDTILMIFEICGYKIKLMDENGATHSLEELSRER